MTTAYLITIPKEDPKLKQAADFTSAIFIDNSGSTSSVLASIGKSFLQAELSICQVTEFNHIVLWNTNATLCTNLETAQPTGGTDPTTIFQNESTKKAFDTSDIIVFVTDGQIDRGSVTKFATFTKDRLNKVLIICIIVHQKLPNPSQINISVVAPLMMVSNVLCLFYDGETFFTLSSKGYISQFYPSPTSLTDYESLPTLNLKELFHSLQLYEYRKIPDGFISVRDNEKEIVAIDFDRFLNTKDLRSISTLTEDDWRTLIQYGKIGNKLPELRAFVSEMKNESIRQDKEKSKVTYNFQYSKQRDELISKIVTLKLNENDDSIELNQLRQQLSDISDQANIEELKYVQYLNENLHQSRHYWNQIQNVIFEQEKGSYSINDFNFASNRANRAKVVTGDDDNDDDAGTLNILDHSNVPLFECAICMEQGPYVLWLKEPNDLEESTNDFIINFPLGGNDKLLQCFVSNPVCGICAKSYITASTANTNGLITLYREPCSGFIPLNWSIESNRRFAHRALYRILTGNKILHHVPMLLVALLDDYQSNWFNHNIKDYLLRQIIANISTTDTFSDEGTRMIFIDALKEIIKQPQTLLRQPIKAVCRILKFCYIFHQLDKEIIVALLRKRFALLCIESLCSKSKFGPTHLILVRDQLYDIIVDTLCGIPIEHSLKKVDVHHEKFQDFLSKSYRSLIDAFDKLSKTIDLDYSRTFPSEFVSFVLYLLTTIKIHDRPMKLYTDLCLQHRQLRDSVDIEWGDFEKQVNDQLFGKYHYQSEVVMPAYAINIGKFSCPSKFFFFAEPLWNKDIENTRVNLTTLMDQIKSNLDEQLRDHFGSTVPNGCSGHFLLHRLVADVLESSHANEDDLNEDMIMNCMIRIGRTKGQAGNIYANTVFSTVVLTIEDYLKFRRQTKNMFQIDNEMLSRSYRYKILTELLASGMDYDSQSDQILFEPSKFKIPNVIQVKNSFDDLKQRVQQRYIASRDKSNNQPNQTCLNIEIKEFIEFAYQMKPDELLPIWAEEQKGIVSSIITDTDQIEQPIKYIAGLDISFVKTNDQAVASMVIFDYSTLNIVAKISVNCRMKIPYIASYLAFREAPVFMKLLDIQKERCSHLTPQVILMDGNGVWHPRRAGIASHFGVLSGIPCFGVSKNVLFADGITREKIEELLAEKAPGEDQYLQVIGDSGHVLGLAYNVTGFIKNAVYISIGHKITLETALKIFQSVTKYRNCEPIRQADLLSREMVTKLT